MAPSFGVELTPLVVRDAGEIEPAVAAFARNPNDGLIVTIGTLTDAHRDVIGKLAAQHRLPAVYPFPFFVRSGGLISYGPDIVDLYRRAAAIAARAQQPAIPVVGFMSARTPEDSVRELEAFQRGLGEDGSVIEGRNVFSSCRILAVTETCDN